MSFNVVKSPESSAISEIHFACEASNWKNIERRLRATAPNEACVFVLTRPSRGAVRTTALLREPIWPLEGEVNASPYGLEIKADYISRAMDAAIEGGECTGITLIHTHPEFENQKGFGRFSLRDDWYEARLFPTITLQRPLALSGRIVIGSEPHDMDGRLWWEFDGGLITKPTQLMRLVGPELRIIEFAQSTWKDHPAPEIMDRSTRIWGAHGRRLLQNLRVGFVGAGGTGSIGIITAATMGVGKIRAWDRDNLSKENLHRNLGAVKRMVGKSKVLSIAKVAKLVATAEPFKVEPFMHWGTSTEGLKELKDCDLLFCCVDKFAPRVPLNDLAYAHLIPTIDIASWIHHSNGRVDAIMTHAHVWSPGIPCAWCRQTLTPLRLTQEAQGLQKGIEHRLPYGLSLDETDGVEPSVLPLNLAGVGIAMMEFMQVALQITERTPQDLKLILPQWELDESDLATIPDCTTELNIALGESVPIRAVD